LTGCPLTLKTEKKGALKAGNQPVKGKISTFTEKHPKKKVDF